MSRIRRNTQPLADRVSQAETDLSKKANTTDLNKKANASDLQTLTGRVTTVETGLTSKASTADLQSLTTRVDTAETNISKKANTTDVAKKCGRPNWGTTTPTKIIDTTATTPITSATIASDGWLYCFGSSGGNNESNNPSGVKVNNNDAMYVLGRGHGVATAQSGIPIPVSKGDTIAAYGTVVCYFYPYK